MTDAHAQRLYAAIESATQIEPLSASDPSFDVAAAYRVLAALHARRITEGWRPLGRKIGFTNTTIWARYGVDRAMWSHVWDRSVVFADSGEATLDLAGLMEPRIEPELVLALSAPPPDGADPMRSLEAVAWIAAGFEIVHSVFPGWRFTAADCTAAFGLHGRLVVGPRLVVDDTNRATLAAAMPRFPVTLLRDEALIDSGTGANVLGSPLRALAHLRDLLAAQPESPPLVAGEIVTTGTLTDAWPIAAGESWSSRYGLLGIGGLRLHFRTRDE